MVPGQTLKALGNSVCFLPSLFFLLMSVAWPDKLFLPFCGSLSASINFGDQAVLEALPCSLSLALVTNSKRPLGFMAWCPCNCYWNSPWMDLWQWTHLIADLSRAFLQTESFLSKDIRKSFCKGKAILTGDFKFGKNTTIWVFLLASNFKHFIGPLLTNTIFGQGSVYVGTKRMYHKQFVCFWACAYVCMSLYML